MRRKIIVCFSVIAALFMIAGCGRISNIAEPVTEALPENTDEAESEEELVLEDAHVIEENPLEITVPEEEEKVFEEISMEEIPGGEKKLTDFLEHLSWWDEDYDCNNPSVYYDFIFLMLSCRYTICDFEIYTDYIGDPSYNEDYYQYDGKGIDWILTNIYNIETDNLSEFKRELSQISPGANDSGYQNYLLYTDGQYWTAFGGVGGGTKIELKNIQTDGDLYRVKYDVYRYNFADDEENAWDFKYTGYALMEYKIIDGKEYWSVYKVSKNNFFEEVSLNYDLKEWETVYAPVLQNNLDYINGNQDNIDYNYVCPGIMEEIGWMDKEDVLNNIGYEIIDINGDDIPELLIGEHNYPDSKERKDTVWGGFTYKDGEIVSFLEAWARNRYMWIGDGKFYNRGSDSATSGSVGFAHLDKDSSQITWDDYYFYEDDKVYHNQSGSYDESESELSDLSPDELLHVEDKYTFDRLNLKPISNK